MEVIKRENLVFDAIITDPPYGIGASNMRLGNGKDLRHGDWDNDAIGQEYIDLILSYCVPTIIFGGNYFDLPKSESWIVWDKRNNGLSFAEAELAWTNLPGKIRIIRHHAPGMDGGKIHSTQKPEMVMRYCIERATKPGDIVLDPFMGSGSTIIAAIQTGRGAIGIEKDSLHFTNAQSRIRREMTSPILPIFGFGTQDE